MRHVNLSLPLPSQPLDQIKVPFSERGFATIRQFLTPRELEVVEGHFPDLAPRTAGARASDFTRDAQVWFSGYERLLDLANTLLCAPARLSRLQAFDKSPLSNWFVPWHQDRAEDAQDRPIAKLEQTVALRLHLDDCGADNGPLEVVPGSHAQQRLEADAIAVLVARTEPSVCLAARGDIVAMRPLIVHRSQPARKPAARRVVQIEYSTVSTVGQRD